MKDKIFLALFALILGSLLPFNRVLAQVPQVSDERLEAVIERVVEEKEVEVMGNKQLYQKLELLVEEGVSRGQKLTVENGTFPAASVLKYGPGDRVVVRISEGPEGSKFFQISDYVRRTPIYLLFGIFIFFTLAVGRLKGLTSLLGMSFSFLVIFIFILPRILGGQDPILTSILGSLIIIPFSFYLSHGLNRKTTIAIVGTVIALIATGVLANIFVEAAHLSGFVSEEAGFLQVAKEGLVNIKGLFLAGMIISALGVLDDVTVSQAAVVEQLTLADSKLSPVHLYRRAMSVGKDHIASMVNTLVLVYAGASLPLLLLFVNNPHPFSEVINYEIIAGEVVRTLVGSIGLILAVPVTTYLAAFLFRRPYGSA